MIFFACFLLFIFTSPLSITACIAAASTRRWQKEKTSRSKVGAFDAESNPLVDESDSDDEEFLDSEDEEYYQTKQDDKRKVREETEADWQLTPRAKFLKEWKKIWTGSNNVVNQHKKEQEDERRKIAREAVREYLRIERKKARKAATKKQELMELPSYGNAVAHDTKH